MDRVLDIIEEEIMRERTNRAKLIDTDRSRNVAWYVWPHHPEWPLRLATVEGLDVRDTRMTNVRPRYNAAPSQELLVVRQNHKTGERSLDLIRCGLVPHWCNDPNGGRKSINAKAESVSRLPMSRDAYALRRCIVPVNGFFRVARH